MKGRIADWFALVAGLLAVGGIAAYFALLSLGNICPGTVQWIIANVLGVVPVLGPPIAVVLGVTALVMGTSRRRLSWTGVWVGAVGILLWLIPLSSAC